MGRDGFRVLLLSLALLGMAAGPAWPAGASAEKADRLAGPSPGGVTGKVMNSRGEPLPGVRITLSRGEMSRTVETDGEGVYCFCRVTPARDYKLLAVKEGFARVAENDLNVGGKKLAVLNLILRPEREFRSAGSEGGEGG